MKKNYSCTITERKSTVNEREHLPVIAKYLFSSPEKSALIANGTTGIKSIAAVYSDGYLGLHWRCPRAHRATHGAHRVQRAGHPHRRYCARPWSIAAVRVGPGHLGTDKWHRLPSAAEPPDASQIQPDHDCSNCAAWSSLATTMTSYRINSRPAAHWLKTALR